MPVLDFTEIAASAFGANRDRFELFARDVLIFLGFRVLEGPDRGADGGRDLVVEELRTGVGGETRVRWLVSCKHKAHSGVSVSSADEPDVQDRLNAHQCSAFLGFYSTVPSSGLSRKLSGASEKYEHHIFDPERIEGALLKNSEGILIAKRYFPRSISEWQLSSKVPANIYSEPIDLRCDYCRKNLLDPEPHGIVVLWRPYGTDGVRQNRVDHVYFSCKGACDRALRGAFRDKKMADSWEDISDLAVPTIYLRSVMSILNNLHDGRVFSNDAFEKLKDMLLNIFPLICRHLSEEEDDRVNSLYEIPKYIGGIGG